MPEQDQENENSVFDFLYVDHERIGLYISQLNEFGSLTSLVRTSETSGKKDFKGKIPAVAEMSAESASRISSTKNFDTRWTQCLSFLDELQSRDMINRSISGIGIGQIILCSGDLAIVDIGGLQRFLKHDSVKTMARKGANAPQLPILTRSQRKQQGQTPANHDEVSAGFDMIAEIPHSVHARMRAEDSHIWCTLKADCMVMSPADVMLKYGVLVDGTWQVLGILDALPGAPVDQVPTLARIFEGEASSPLLLGAVQIFTQLRGLLGRPPNCHGVTPLAIFREINREAMQPLAALE